MAQSFKKLLDIDAPILFLILRLQKHLHVDAQSLFLFKSLYT